MRNSKIMSSLMATTMDAAAAAAAIEIPVFRVAFRLA